MAAGSTIGTIFKVTTWGESHGKAIGVVVDGCPAGLPLKESDIQKLLDRRKPGQSRFTTQRKEGDEVEILSGVFEGKTTGTPISMIVRNTDQRSKDYSNIASCFRPGHADYTFEEKYGFRDYRGGGRSSARETIGRVAAGAIAEKFLKQLNISVTAYAKSIGPVEVSPERMDLSEIPNNRFRLPDADSAKEAEHYLDQKIAECDSVGGVVECVISGLPAGLGEPVFEKLDANLAKAILSIGAVKGFEIGDGGVLGGISDGSDVIFRAAFKPTPSIAKSQETVTKDGENIDLVIHGRHDPVVVPRAVVVVESMAAITAMDMLLMSMTSRLDLIQMFFQVENVDDSPEQ